MYSSLCIKYTDRARSDLSGSWSLLDTLRDTLRDTLLDTFKPRTCPGLARTPNVTARQCWPGILSVAHSLSSTTTLMSLNPLPWPYYFTFAIYEPLLTIVSCIWAFADPREVNWSTAGPFQKGRANTIARHLIHKHHGRPLMQQAEN